MSKPEHDWWTRAHVCKWFLKYYDSYDFLNMLTNKYRTVGKVIPLLFSNFLFVLFLRTNKVLFQKEMFRNCTLS